LDDHQKTRTTVKELNAHHSEWIIVHSVNHEAVKDTQLAAVIEKILKIPNRVLCFLKPNQKQA
jgi:hypothetical protein